MPIVIRNVGATTEKEAANPDGQRRYTVAINEKVVSSFIHRRCDGLAACLRAAAASVTFEQAETLVQAYTEAYPAMKKLRGQNADAMIRQKIEVRAQKCNAEIVWGEKGHPEWPVLAGTRHRLSDGTWAYVVDPKPKKRKKVKSKKPLRVPSSGRVPTSD